MYLFIAIFGVVITALVEATVAKAANCVDNVEERGQRNCVLLHLKTQRGKTNVKLPTIQTEVPQMQFYYLLLSYFGYTKHCIIKRAVGYML